jgi:hypothetical protein
MVFIYILQLENEKYYVGKTNNPIFRLEQHFNSNASAWTQKYPPVYLLQILPDCDDFDEDKYTLKYMKLFGINNVRGGSFCEIELSNDNKLTIQKMLNGSSDKCYNCQKFGHFAKECPEKYAKNNCENEYVIIQKCNNSNVCYRCGRDGHYVENCYATTDINGNTINNSDSDSDSDYDIIWECEYCGKEFESEKSAELHEKKCSQKQNDNSDICYRCGREGHYATDCYAKTDINGNYICANLVKNTKINKYAKNISNYKCKYCNKKFDTQKGVTFHENIYCKNK